MKNRIKALWARRPRLSRGKQTARNLLLALLMGVILWGLHDFPIPSDRLAFRRAEAANWVGPSEIQGSLSAARGEWTLGVYQDWVLLLRNGGGVFEYWPRAETAPTLCPIPDSSVLDGEAGIAAVEVPPGTASARLEVEADCWWAPTPGGGKILRAYPEEDPELWAGGKPERWTLSRQVEGRRISDRLYRFLVLPAEVDQNGLDWRVVSALYEWHTYTQPPEKRDVNCTLEAVFYDQNGVELGRASLASSEN